MEVQEALARLRFLVNHGRFQIVRRRKRMAMPGSRDLAKELVRHLLVTDFVKKEPNRNNPTQFVWIFKTSNGEVYYLKFVFVDNFQKVVFISFHLDH